MITRIVARIFSVCTTSQSCFLKISRLSLSCCNRESDECFASASRAELSFDHPSSRPPRRLSVHLHYRTYSSEIRPQLIRTEGFLSDCPLQCRTRSLGSDKSKMMQAQQRGKAIPMTSRVADRIWLKAAGRKGRGRRDWGHIQTITSSWQGTTTCGRLHSPLVARIEAPSPSYRYFDCKIERSFRSP